MQNKNRYRRPQRWGSSAPANHRALATVNFHEMDCFAVSAPELEIIRHSVRSDCLTGLVSADRANCISILYGKFITFSHRLQGFSLTFLRLSVDIP